MNFRTRVIFDKFFVVYSLKYLLKYLIPCLLFEYSFVPTFIMIQSAGYMEFGANKVD